MQRQNQKDEYGKLQYGYNRYGHSTPMTQNQSQKGTGKFETKGRRLRKKEAD